MKSANFRLFKDVAKTIVEELISNQDEYFGKSELLQENFNFEVVDFEAALYEIGFRKIEVISLYAHSKTILNLKIVFSPDILTIEDYGLIEYVLLDYVIDKKSDYVYILTSVIIEETEFSDSRAKINPYIFSEVFKSVYIFDTVKHPFMETDEKVLNLTNESYAYLRENGFNFSGIKGYIYLVQRLTFEYTFYERLLKTLDYKLAFLVGEANLASFLVFLGRCIKLKSNRWNNLYFVFDLAYIKQTDMDNIKELSDIIGTNIYFSCEEFRKDMGEMLK